MTFLFTDIEGSTTLLGALGDEAFEGVLSGHHSVMRAAVADYGGVEVSTEGDAFFVVFADAGDAVAMTLSAQRALKGLKDPDGRPVRVRMGLHTGTGRLGGDNYSGMTVNQAARIASAAHGGQILASPATCATAGALPDGATWHSLGEHRLKDLHAPVELSQLCHPDLDREFPPPRTLERAVHNLPIQSSSFLGRAEELQTGAKLLAATRLLTIVGPGGTGKTRVAFELATEQLQEFPDGVWLCELAPLADGTLVRGALLAVIGLRPASSSDDDPVVGFFRNRQALVILDNCEQVVEAAAALTRELLDGCESVTVLATSREPLRIRGESVWALPPLAVGDRTAPLEVLASTDAVRLRSILGGPAGGDELDRNKLATPHAVSGGKSRLRATPE